MDIVQSTISISGKVDHHLWRIANILLMNASFIDNPGLLNGKMGIAIFFYHFARYTSSKIFEDYAGELVDEIYVEINKKTPFDFENGLTGIGWGIEYLVKNKFLEADTDVVLSELDKSIYSDSIYRPLLLESESDMFGYGLYSISRLRDKENDYKILNTLSKKQLLMYLIDKCEGILVHKNYFDSNIRYLRVDTLNSLTWFLLELFRIGLFQLKVENLFHTLPQHIESALIKSDERSDQSQMIILIESVIPCLEDKSIWKKLRSVINMEVWRDNGNESDQDRLVKNFVKNAWQQIVYEPYIRYNQPDFSFIEKVFSVIDNEEYWSKRIEKINKNNLGLTGLAGLGLGLLSGRMKEELL